MREAEEVAGNAYVPYSHFRVGAALLTNDGQMYKGCNIENASFGLTNCAERTAIFKAVSEGHRDFEMIVVYGDTEQPISPCGACRQVMAEFFKQDSKVILIAEDKSTVVMTVGELLPYSLQTYNSLVVIFFIKQGFLQVYRRSVQDEIEQENYWNWSCCCSSSWSCGLCSWWTRWISS